MPPTPLMGSLQHRRKTGTCDGQRRRGRVKNEECAINFLLFYFLSPSCTREAEGKREIERRIKELEKFFSFFILHLLPKIAAACARGRPPYRRSSWERDAERKST